MLVLGEKFVHPPRSTPTGRELIAIGVKVETDMLIHDKCALVPLSLEESALVPKERIGPFRMVLVEKCDDDGNRFVKARLDFNERQSCYSAGHSLFGS